MGKLYGFVKIAVIFTDGGDFYAFVSLVAVLHSPKFRYECDLILERCDDVLKILFSTSFKIGFL